MLSFEQFPQAARLVQPKLLLRLDGLQGAARGIMVQYLSNSKKSQRIAACGVPGENPRDLNQLVLAAE